MTEQRMNQVVAECLGYEVSQIAAFGQDAYQYDSFSPDGTWLDTSATEAEAWEEMPDFCNDKNSHAPLFELLYERGLAGEFYEGLNFPKNTLEAVSQPAVRIVEAFLRAVGRWETDNDGR